MSDGDAFDTFGADAADIDNLPAFFGGESDDEEGDEIEQARQRFLEEQGLDPAREDGDGGGGDGTAASPGGADDNMDEVGALAGIDSLLDDGGTVDASAIESQVIQQAQQLQARAQQAAGWSFDAFANQFDAGGNAAAGEGNAVGGEGGGNIAVRQVPRGPDHGEHQQQQQQQQPYPPQHFMSPHPAGPYGMPGPGGMMMPPPQFGGIPPPGYPGGYGMAAPPPQGGYMHPQQMQQMQYMQQQQAMGMAPYPQQPFPQQQMQPPAPQQQQQVKEEPTPGAPHELQAAPSDWIGGGDGDGAAGAAGDALEPERLSLREIQEQQAQARRQQQQQQQQQRGGRSTAAAAVVAAGHARAQEAAAGAGAGAAAAAPVLDDFRSDFARMPWTDLRYVVSSLHRQHQAVEAQSKSHFYTAALARKAAGAAQTAELLGTSAASAPAAARLAAETAAADGADGADGAERHAKFTKWSDERSELWARTHHTLGKYKKNDITRPVEMLHVDMDGLRAGDATGAFADVQWKLRKVIEDAMRHVLAIERCARRVAADRQLAGVNDPQVAAELEGHRADLSNALQLRRKENEAWQLLGCVQLAKGKRMVLRALGALDGVRLGVFLEQVFREIAHFLFARDETPEMAVVNEQVADALVAIIHRVELGSLELLSACFAALVQTQTAEILRFYLITPVSAKVIEALIMHGTHLVDQAKQVAAAGPMSASVEAAVERWEATTARLTASVADEDGGGGAQ